MYYRQYLTTLATLVVSINAVQQVNQAKSKAKSCPLPDTGRNGATKSATLLLYDCIKPSSTSMYACRKMREMSLAKGKTTNLYYDVNGYPVMAKFYGSEVCVSYFKVEKAKNGSIYKQKCEDECFDDYEDETYYEDGCDSTTCTGRHGKFRFGIKSAGENMEVTEVVSINVIDQLSMAVSGAKTCPLPKGISGEKASVTLRLYNCNKASSTSMYTCTKIKDVPLKKGTTTNLNYNVNGYSVMAKFFGKQVCVSYFKLEKAKNGSIYKQKCEEECFDDYEDETYYQAGCDPKSCTGQHKKFKFGLTSAGKEMKASQIIITAVLSLLGMAYLFSA